MAKTLGEWAPREFHYGEYGDTRAFKMKDVKVASEHSFCSKNWPGPQKNVSSWVMLENGYAVGWNENPARGWSFPVFKVKG